MLLWATLFQSCSKDLEIKNENSPDLALVYGSASDVEGLVTSLYNTIYTQEHSYGGIEMMLAVASDNVTCSYGNAGMRDFSYEPRIAWNNSPSYSNRTQTYDYFNGQYSAIVTASNILKGIDGGLTLSNNPRAIAFSKFALGVAYGNLSLAFDKTWITDNKITVEQGILSTTSSYKDVANAALGYFDEALAQATANSFTIPASWLGTSGDYSSADFVKLVNTSAARLLSYSPRNSTENAAVDWNKVKQYADAGITSDFVVEQDGYVNWYDEAGDYLTYTGWGQADMYTINMLDPTQPQHWTDIATFPHPPASTNPLDKRLNTDFAYLASNTFIAARGYYHFSNYRNKRYDAVYLAGVGPKPEIYKTENDLLRAEARVYTGDLSGAAAIINASTYVTRGQLPAVAAVQSDLINAIHHERFVELYTTGVGVQFFDMRKLDLMQKGTALHFPIPAQTLETIGESLPFYTFGGVDAADGINTSNGGWR